MSLTDSTLVSKVILISTGALYPNSIFSYTFKTISDSHLEVYAGGVLKTLTTDYTVTGASDSGTPGGDDNGGAVIFVSGSEPAVSTEIIIRRVVPLDQQTDIPSAPAKFPEEAVETALDKLTMIDQQQDEKAGRALTMVETVNTDTISNALADPADNAGKVLIASSTGFTYAEYSAADYVSPLTTEGDLVIRDATIPTRLAVGTTGKVLQVDTAVSGKVKWGIGHTTQGDVITHDGSDTARLALGNPDEVLGSDGTDLVWQVMPWQQGQCRFVFTSSTVCTLLPYNGNKVVLKRTGLWRTYTIPDAGTTLPIGSLSSSTLYYVYAGDDSFGAVGLYTSTTPPVRDADTGYQIKTGDATLLLVGMVYITSGGAFADTLTQRYVRSWFHDSGKEGIGALAADRTTASATYVAIHSEMTVFVLVWAREKLISTAGGSTTNAVNTTATFAVSTDGTTANLGGAVSYRDVANIAGAPVQVWSTQTITVSGAAAAVVTFTLLAKIDSGTLTALGTAVDGRTRQSILATGGK